MDVLVNALRTRTAVSSGYGRIVYDMVYIRLLPALQAPPPSASVQCRLSHCPVFRADSRQMQSLLQLLDQTLFRPDKSLLSFPTGLNLLPLSAVRLV